MNKLYVSICVMLFASFLGAMQENSLPGTIMTPRIQRAVMDAVRENLEAMKTDADTSSNIDLIISRLDRLEGETFILEECVDSDQTFYGVRPASSNDRCLRFVFPKRAFDEIQARAYSQERSNETSDLGAADRQPEAEAPLTPRILRAMQDDLSIAF